MGGVFMSVSTISNSSSYVMVSGTADNDYIKNSGDYVTIQAGAGDDYVYNNHWGDYVSINGGTGNDSVYNDGGYSASINGGAGNDSIYHYSDWNASIAGGAGDDSIYNYFGDRATIDGGAGNDFISLNSSSDDNVIKYASGDGNDTIVGFDYNDTIQIMSGSISSHYKSGDDYIINVGSGTISLKGAANSLIHVRNSKGQLCGIKSHGEDGGKRNLGR